MTAIVSISSGLPLKAFITKLNKTKGRIHVWAELAASHDSQKIGTWVWCSRKDVKEALSVMPDNSYVRFRYVPDDDALFIRL